MPSPSSPESIQPLRIRQYEPELAQFSGGRPKRRRACARCKKHKVGCELVDGERYCQRCWKAKVDCTPAPREPKKTGKGRAVCLAIEADAPGRYAGDTVCALDASDSQEEDEGADEVLDGKQTERPADEDKAPVDFICESVPSKDKPAASMTSLPLGAPTSLKNYTAGETNNGDLLPPCYLRSTGFSGQDKLEIAAVLTISEIGMLFWQFMTRTNPYMSMFDERLYTVQYVTERSPFLLAVMVMISSRHYADRPDAYMRLVNVTKRLADEAITNMAKSIFHVQAFILLASYPMPDPEYLNNKPWLYSGVAFRMATDLGLYKQQPLQAATEALEREALNRTRTWIVCFYLDESISVHFGRPATISQDDHVVVNAMNWWLTNRGRYAHPHDVHLVVFVDLLRAFRSALDKVVDSKVEGRSGIVDYYRICREFDDEVAGLVENSRALFNRYTDRTNAVCVLREHMGDFTTQYSRLIIHSIAFYRSRHQVQEVARDCLSKCLQSAFRVLEILIEDMVPTGLLRYACDGYFWYASFASAFLLKLLGTENSDMVDDRTRECIVIRVRGLIEALGSHSDAVESSHPPRLFSRFLNGMLSKHIRGAKYLATSVASPGGRIISHGDGMIIGDNEAVRSSDFGACSVAALPRELDSLSMTSFGAQASSVIPSHSSFQAENMGMISGFGSGASPHVGDTYQPIYVTREERLTLGDFLIPFGGVTNEVPMDDIVNPELFAGIMALDQTQWWADPNLSLDVPTMSVLRSGDVDAESGTSDQAGFIAYDPLPGNSFQLF